MVFRRLELEAVNRAVRTMDGAAGKSINVAKVLAELGARPLATGFVGGERGQDLIQRLTSRGIAAEFVSVTPLTRQCISIIDEATGSVTELVEESTAVDDRAYETLREIIEKALPACNAVVMSGSLTPGGPVGFYGRVTEMANRLGKLTVVDAQGAPLTEALRYSPGLVKPNRLELAATVQRPLGTETEVIEAMWELRKRGAERVVVTAGKSATLALDGDSVWRVQPPTISAVNPIGSGDAFTAALVWRLTQNEPLGQACGWAVAAGAANALSAMPGDLEKKDVESLVGQVAVAKL
jgi:tagatose 6-phosphate kinase